MSTERKRTGPSPRRTWLDRERPDLAAVVTRNVRAMKEMRDAHERRRTLGDRVSDFITDIFGSMPILVLHAFGLAFWILANSGVLHGIKPWDPFPFGMLASGASIEAIFLSIFVLISQSRQGKLDEQRDELDLQINLLTEHEVTRLISMTDALLKHHKIEAPGLQDVEELKQEVPPEKVLSEIENVENQADRPPGSPAA